MIRSSMGLGVLGSRTERSTSVFSVLRANLSCASFLLSRPTQLLHFFTLDNFRTGRAFVPLPFNRPFPRR
jgi:hypothetical protein